MTTRSPQVITADAIAVISEDLDSLHDEIRNANKPLVEAIGSLAAEIRAMRDDLTAYQSATNDQISRLRKKAANGSPAAE